MPEARESTTGGGGTLTPASGASSGGAAQPTTVVVVEIADPLNRQVLFGPNQERLRGRWDPHNLMLGDTSSVGLMQMPVIPGVLVALDLREKRGSITDPLAAPENARLLAQTSNFHRELWKQAISPRPSVVQEEMSDDDVATWLYWIMRVVIAGQARVVQGVVPKDEKAVKKLVPRGHIRKDFYNSMARRKEEEDGE
jgi:hypothetical protein